MNRIIVGIFLAAMIGMVGGAFGDEVISLAQALARTPSIPERVTAEAYFSGVQESGCGPQSDIVCMRRLYFTETPQDFYSKSDNGMRFFDERKVCTGACLRVEEHSYEFPWLATDLKEGMRYRLDVEVSGKGKARVLAVFPAKEGGR